MTPLIITDVVTRQLEELRSLAAAHPVDMPELVERLKNPEGKATHRKQMSAQTVFVPASFDVTFSIERGHPCGICRHMSMSSRLENRMPTPSAVWMIAEKLGFVGDLRDCTVWLEELDRIPGRAKAVNVVQPIAAIAASTRAS